MKSKERLEKLQKLIDEVPFRIIAEAEEIRCICPGDNLTKSFTAGLHIGYEMAKKESEGDRQNKRDFKQIRNGQFF